MRGGIPGPGPDLNLQHRELLRARIHALAEGTLFRPSDIAETQAEIAELMVLRGIDHVHVMDDYFTGVVETEYLRRLPRLDRLLDSYMRLRGCRLVETGDWTAWRLGLKQWEPLEGHRYHSDGPAEVLSYGRFMKLRMLPSPAWCRADSENATLFRAVHDLTEKDLRAAMDRVVTIPGLAQALPSFTAAIAFGKSIPEDSVPENVRHPRETVAILEALEERRMAALTQRAMA